MKRDAKYVSWMICLLWWDEVSKEREKLKPKYSTKKLTAFPCASTEDPATCSGPHCLQPELPATSSDLLGLGPEVPVASRKFRVHRWSCPWEWKLSFPGSSESSPEVSTIQPAKCLVWILSFPRKFRITVESSGKLEIHTTASFERRPYIYPSLPHFVAAASHWRKTLPRAKSFPSPLILELLLARIHSSLEWEQRFERVTWKAKQDFIFQAFNSFLVHNPRLLLLELCS
jgi:hypothetical protein